jgi:hypothetical protein
VGVICEQSKLVQMLGCLGSNFVHGALGSLMRHSYRATNFFYAL